MTRINNNQMGAHSKTLIKLHFLVCILVGTWCGSHWLTLYLVQPSYMLPLLLLYCFALRKIIQNEIVNSHIGHLIYSLIIHWIWPWLRLNRWLMLRVLNLLLEKKELSPSPLANAYASLKQSVKVKRARTILLKTIATRRDIDLNST